MGREQVVIVGTGLIGTSIGLALSGHGVRVLLADRDAAAVALAADLGAGIPLPEARGKPADLAVIAVPPGAVAATLLDAQQRRLARFYTDVASVKRQPITEAAKAGCDLAAFVGGHPMGGRERSGPLAARADLFLGRPWVLCPTAESEPGTLAAATDLADACGALPVRLSAEEHDRAVALVSHAPHVVAAAMAARFAAAPGAFLDLIGQGGRDTTRIAAADPALWFAILEANADPVADLLEKIAAELGDTACDLRADRPIGPSAVARVLADGLAGNRRIPGKHGGRQGRYTKLPVLVADRPGELALLFQAAGVAGINIEDVTIEHSPGRSVGVVELAVRPECVAVLAKELRARGWSVPADATF